MVDYGGAEGYNITWSDRTMDCYSGRINTNNGLWYGQNPLAPDFPIFAHQIVVIVAFVRSLRILLRPLKVPSFVPDVLGGLLIGQNFLGGWLEFRRSLFPTGSMMVLETIAGIGVLYHSFLLGLAIDVKTMLSPGAEAWRISLAGIFFPFVVGAGVYCLLQDGGADRPSAGPTRGVSGAVFCGTALGVTSFPILTQALADLKLLHTDIGRMAMSVSMVSDVGMWALFSVGMAASRTLQAASNVLVSTVVLVLISYFLLTPAVMRLARTAAPPADGPAVASAYTLSQLCLVLAGVCTAGFVADLCGSHSFVGAFLFGVCVPDGALRTVLIEKMEDTVSGLLVPLFYGITGPKADLRAVASAPWGVGRMLFCVVFSCLAKVAASASVYLFHGMPLVDGLALGVLMNTKGLTALVSLNVAKDKMVIDDLLYASMLASLLVMTALVPAVLPRLYNTKRSLLHHSRRTVQGLDPGGEFRTLVCVHSAQTVSGLTGLLQCLNPSPRSPLRVFALHLVELTGRASAMLVVHGARGTHGRTRADVEAERILDTFKKFEQENEGAASVQPLTAMSSYATMHEDVCRYAEDKQVALILLPFHRRQQRGDGIAPEEEDDDPAVRATNQHVLIQSPCSVGVFCDRGRWADPLRVAVLFFGGPDDREALCCGRRMVGREGTDLTLVRFVSGGEVAGAAPADEQAVGEFRAGAGRRARYLEVVSGSGDETVVAVKGMDGEYDLFVVGKGDGVTTVMTSGLDDWSEFPELGPVGDLLVSPDCSSEASVLVVQQAAGGHLTEAAEVREMWEGDRDPGSKMLRVV